MTARSSKRLIAQAVVALACFTMLMHTLFDQPQAQEATQRTGPAPVAAIVRSQLPADPLTKNLNPAVAVQRGNPLWSIPVSALDATRDRPLFSSSRRSPPHLRRERTSGGETGPSSFSLVGIIAGEEDGIAILRDSATKIIVRLRTGETHRGWTLEAVQGREALLQKGREAAVLSLPNPPAK